MEQNADRNNEKHNAVSENVISEKETLDSEQKKKKAEIDDVELKILALQELHELATRPEDS